MKKSIRKPIILCVDDERIILESLRNEIKFIFKGMLSVEIAESGEEALELLKIFRKDKIDVPIIISDYVMPGMNGDKFLIESKNISPNSKRIMLTGQASNDGVGNVMINAGLYRFIAKPWGRVDLELTLTEAFKSFYKDKSIVVQETKLEELNRILNLKLEEKTNELNDTNEKLKILLDNTFKGLFLILINFISNSNSRIAERIKRINELGTQICKILYPELKWQFEISNILSHLNIINFNKELIDKYLSGEKITQLELNTIRTQMASSSEILINLNFLEEITDGIRNMFFAFKFIDTVSISNTSNTLSKLLKVLNEYDDLLIKGVSKKDAFYELETMYHLKEEVLIELLKSLELKTHIYKSNFKSINVNELKVGMKLFADILDSSNVVVIEKNEIIDIQTLTYISKLFNKGKIIEPILIEINN